MIVIRTRHLAVVVPLVFAAGIGLTMALGAWHTTTTKEPARYASGVAAGRANPADIRGSYTLGDIAAAFPGLPLGDLARAFGVSSDASAYAVKNLEQAAPAGTTDETVGTDSVRLFVARYLGLPYEPEQATRLPAAAVEILAATGRLEPSVLADVRARSTEPRPVIKDEEKASGTTAEPSPSPADRAVKGKTTFRELAEWGVDQESLAAALGKVPGEPQTTLKDWSTANSRDFAELRLAVQALVDAANP
jgi:hypothetical protein